MMIHRQVPHQRALSTIQIFECNGLFYVFTKNEIDVLGEKQL